MTLDHGRLVFPEAGQTVMTATTKNGVPLSGMVSQANVQTGKALFVARRCTRPRCLTPEKCGIIPANTDRSRAEPRPTGAGAFNRTERANGRRDFPRLAYKVGGPGS